VRATADASVDVGVADVEGWAKAEAALSWTHLLAAALQSHGTLVANQTACSP
jgi:hypothetical protein